jgi:phage gpG-like protein
VSVSLSVNGQSLRAARNRARDARRALSDASVPMRQASIFLDQWVKRNFREQGKKVGGWTPFAYGGRLTTKDKSNAKIRGRYVNTTAQLLQDSSHLRLSMLPFATATVAGIGSDLPYAEAHNAGVLPHLPERRMLPNEAEVKTDIRQILGNWVRVTLKGYAGA